MKAEEFEEHPIFDRLNSLEEILSNDEAKEKIDLDNLSFFQTVFDFINQRVKLILPELVQKKDIDAASTELHTGVSNINSYLGNNNIGHITNVLS